MFSGSLKSNDTYILLVKSYMVAGYLDAQSYDMVKMLVAQIQVAEGIPSEIDRTERDRDLWDRYQQALVRCVKKRTRHARAAGVCSTKTGRPGRP